MILYGVDQNDEYLHPRLKLGFEVFWYKGRESEGGNGWKPEGDGC